MSFERWINSEKRTVAFRQFENDHSQLNCTYWHSVSEKSYFDYCYRSAKKSKNELPYDILKIDPTHKSSKNIVNNLEKWNKSRKEMSNWIRLNSLLSLYSYFELYINRVTKTAQQSDPGLFFGSSQSIDGAKILKQNGWKNANLPNYSLEVTKGTWQQRISALEKIFSIKLPNAKNRITDLEKTRTIRNSIAHYYGQDLDDSSLFEYSSDNSVLLNEEDLIKYFGLLYEVANEVDENIIKYIGEYEIIYYLHNYIKENKTVKSILLKKSINSTTLWEPKGIVYCEELLDYFRNKI